ncbi:hypothetical protein [Spirosoma litoris]
MDFEISVRKGHDAEWFDHGENYRDFDKANEEARRYFNSLTGLSATWDADGCYEDPETGIAVFVMEPIN